MDLCFAEETKIVNMQAPVSISAAAMTTEWISMKNAQRATWFLSLGVLHSSFDDATISINVANDASGTKSATLSAKMDFVLENVWKSGALPSDTLTKQTVSTSGSIDSVAIASTDDGRIFVIEVEASKLGTFSSSSTTYDADYVRLAIPSAGGGGAGLVSCFCILTGLRYKEDSPPTSIT